jgi:hypothetical protein
MPNGYHAVSSIRGLQIGGRGMSDKMERLAIKVSYLPATDHRDQRIKVTDKGKMGLPNRTYTQAVDISISDQENRRNAAQGFLNKYIPNTVLCDVAMIYDNDTFFIWKHQDEK